MAIHAVGLPMDSFPCGATLTGMDKLIFGDQAEIGRLGWAATCVASGDRDFAAMSAREQSDLILEVLGICNGYAPGEPFDGLQLVDVWVAKRAVPSGQLITVDDLEPARIVARASYFSGIKLGFEAKRDVAMGALVNVNGTELDPINH